MKYQVLVEFEDPVEGRLPIEAMHKIVQSVKANTDGRVVWVRRMDPIWCEPCQEYHPGAGKIVVD